MNWLPELTAKIRNSGCPVAQIEALVLRAVEVAAICDKFVPEAPPLQFDTLPDSGDGPELEVAWFNRRKMRTLAVAAQQDGKTYLHLYDDGRGSQNIIDPRHEQLKSAVTSFFEGWVPHD
jgi:hypothetical protein